MASDREILREVWDGKLPISFQLDPDENIEMQQPDPFYAMVPRLSYFPLVTDKVRKHFSRFISKDNSDQDMWLEYNGAPLKWHFPIGVLFDMHFAPDESQLPWNIVVHFSNYPEATIFRCSKKEIVESHFMSTIKEADMLKHKGQIVSQMQKKDHNQLWMGLQNDKFDQFWAVNRKLMEATADQERYFKHIPFRLYFNDGSYKQKSVRPVTDNGLAKTLNDLVNEMDLKGVVLRIHGIQPPLVTPLQWLSEHLSYPDNFLHFVVEKIK